jgi:hypothetical protein
MSLDNDWEKTRGPRWSVGDAGMGALRVALLFGSAAVALALILTPVVENQTERMLSSSYPGRGLDGMATGTIGHRPGDAYVVRRSVLQASPASVCVIRQNGTRSGAC